MSHFSLRVEDFLPPGSEGLASLVPELRDRTVNPERLVKTLRKLRAVHSTLDQNTHEYRRNLGELAGFVDRIADQDDRLDCARRSFAVIASRHADNKKKIEEDAHESADFVAWLARARLEAKPVHRKRVARIVGALRSILDANLELDRARLDSLEETSGKLQSIVRASEQALRSLGRAPRPAIAADPRPDIDADAVVDDIMKRTSVARAYLAK